MPQGLNAPEGVYGTSQYLFYYPNTPANKAFADEFYMAYKRYPKATALIGYMTAEFIAEGFKKAGKVDKEAFIKALEGMTLDSPVGPLTIRACDHQLELPMYWGITKKDPEDPFLVSGDTQVIPAKDYMPTCDEILKQKSPKPDLFRECCDGPCLCPMPAGGALPDLCGPQPDDDPFHRLYQA